MSVFRAEDMSVKPKQLADTIKMIDEGKINITVGKTVFRKCSRQAKTRKRL